MTLLREGDGVNFQKASCTLDGCVKIYTNRVDSVATETGKLLSGLADSGNKKKKGDADGEGEGEDGDEEEGEDGVKKRKKRVCEVDSCHGIRSETVTNSYTIENCGSHTSHFVRTTTAEEDGAGILCGSTF
jgi:hypothetical protein